MGIAAGMDSPENPALTTAEEAIFAPLLNIDTLVLRPVIAIDGARYEILAPDELSIVDSHRLGVWGRRVQQLAEGDAARVWSAEDGAENEAELEQLVDRIARRVAVGVPDDVYGKLTGAHKQAIADVFTGLLLRGRFGVAEAIARAAGMETVATSLNAIGGSPLPASSGSMAASPATGWKTRLSRWFAR